MLILAASLSGFGLLPPFGRNDTRPGLPGLLLLFILMCLWLPLKVNGTDGGDGPPKIGIVAVDALNLRAAPSKQAPVVMKLKKGTEIEVLEGVSDWLKVRINNRTGYVSRKKPYITLRAAGVADPKAGAGPIAAIDRKKEKIRQIESTLRQRTAGVERMTQKETGLLAQLNRIDISLDTARRRLADLKVKLISLDREIYANQESAEDLTKRIAARQAYASRRLIALYKMMRIGKYAILASAGSFPQFLENKSNLERVLAADQRLLAKLVRDKSALAQLKAAQNRRRQDKLALEKQVQQQMREAALKKERRLELLATVRRKKSHEIEIIEDLKSAAAKLERQIKRITTGGKAGSSMDAAATGGFEGSKGLLNIPVNGTVINKFGAYRDSRYGIEYFRSGIDIRSDQGEPIVSVYGGEIVYAGWFNGFGNMIIISHGDKYYTVYAHLEEMFKSKGDRIKIGEVIATVGDSGPLTGPGLYFEVRHHSKPLNPMEWIKSG